MKKICAIILSTMITAGVLLTGCSNGTAEVKDTTTATETGKEALSAEDIKVGFIYVGPIGDGGYTFSHDQGRLYLEEKLGVKTTYQESVPESAEVKKVIRDMIDGGSNVIIGTSFGYMDYMKEVAKDFPEVKFLHCSGYESADNMANYFGRMYEPRYLSGIVAGMKTESDVIGYVAAFPIPEVIRGINAFTLGVQSVNPDAVVKVRWTNTWYDPAKEKEAAKALLDEKADVIAQHQDTAGPQQAAEERGKFSIGYNTDSKEVAPKSYMTAPVWNWGPYYVAQVEAVVNGTWNKESYWGGMKDDIVALAELTENAPAEATAKVEEARKAIVEGNYEVFAGPIKDQEGNVVVEEGKTLTDAEMLSMKWFVEGVEGSITQ